MQLPFVPQRGLYLPAGLPRIDWSNPLTRGLRNIWVHDGSYIPVSLVTGFPLNQGANLATPGFSQAGMGWKYNGSNRINYGLKSTLSGNNACSLFLFVTPLATTASQRYYQHGNSGATSPNIAIGVSPTVSSAFRILCTDGSANAVSVTEPTGSLVVNKPVAIGGNAAFGSGTIGLYINGVVSATGSATAASNGTLNATSIGASFANSSSSLFANATIHLAAEWDRQLTDQEHLLLGRNPTAFLIYPEDEIFATQKGTVSTLLNSGTAVTTSIGDTIATVTVATATGGTAPYTYQWYRSTSSGFTPGAGNIVTGATSTTLNDTGLTDGVTYYYKNKVTDNVAATSISNQVSAIPQAVTASGVTFSNVLATALTVSTSVPTGGTGPYTYQFQRAPDSSGSPGTFANIGSNSSSLSFNDTGLTPVTKYWYRVVVTDSLSATNTGLSSSQTTASGSPVVAGTASVSSYGDAIATVTSTAASGGAATLTYQWFRSTDPTVSGSAVAGATSLTLNDTGLTDGTPYYYTMVATDGFTSATTNQIAVAPAKPVYLGVIGDSWCTETCTSGGSAVVSASAAGNLVGNQLQALFQNGTQVILSNQGVGGTNGNDWAPAGSNMATAVAAFAAAHSTTTDWTILVHLGINDSSVNFSTPTGGESTSQYQTYMNNIANYLVNTWGAGRVVFVGPPAIEAISSNHTTNGVKLLSQYFGVLQTIATSYPGKVYATLSEFDYLINNQSILGLDQVHPQPSNSNGQGGSVYLAGLWAKAVYDALNPPATVAATQAQFYYRVGSPLR